MKELKMSLPVAYMAVFFKLSSKARELGYALAVHGSVTRDCDLIAVPWTDAAVNALELAHALIAESGGTLCPFEKDEYFLNGSPGAKPHGRLVWSILLGGQHYIDLSVMPRESS
jgi:hypothetical protein